MTNSNRLAHEWYKLRPLVPTYLHLIGSALFPIYIAAHASLRRPPSAAPAERSKLKQSDHGNVEGEEEPSSPLEALSTSDAVLFPVLAGATLTGLYLIIKWLEDPSILNKILGYYFSWVGTFFTFSLARDTFSTVRSFLFPTQFSAEGDLYMYDTATNAFTVLDEARVETKDNRNSGFLGRRATRSINFLRQLRRALYYKITCAIETRHPLPSQKNKFGITIVDVSAIAVAAIVSYVTTFQPFGKTPWYLTNLQGFSFCYGSLQYVTPGSSDTGTLLLLLLFCYDIYMVFYTPMMVTVATKLDVPIKLLFPRPDPPKPIGALPGSKEMEDYLKELAKKKTMAMLGLGDVVVPGIMIAFALRFDLYRYYLSLKTTRQSLVVDSAESKTDDRPVYLPARGMWAERFYTARKLWSPALQAKDFPKPYFKATIVGYTAGMIATLLVMQIWQHAQPALLYLVPGVLSSFWGVALWKGEVKLLWKYDESAEDKEQERKAKIDGKESTEQQHKDRKRQTGKADGDEDNANKTEDVPESSTRDYKQAVLSFNIYVPPPLAKANGQVEKKADVLEEGQKLPEKDHSGSSASTPELVSKEELDEDAEVDKENMAVDSVRRRIRKRA